VLTYLHQIISCRQFAPPLNSEFSVHLKPSLQQGIQSSVCVSAVPRIPPVECLPIGKGHSLARSAFRIPHSAFRIPHSAFRIRRFAYQPTAFARTCDDWNPAASTVLAGSAQRRTHVRASTPRVRGPPSASANRRIPSPPHPRVQQTSPPHPRVRRLALKATVGD
jgi:hypothetical protein